MFEKMDSLGCLVVFFVLVAWCFAGFVFGCLCGFVLKLVVHFFTRVPARGPGGVQCLND